MSALQDSTFLASTKCAVASSGQLRNLRNAPKALKKATSLAALYDAARHPTRALGGFRDTVEGWYDGLTAEERERRALQDVKKQVLYLQQRNVSRTELESWPPTDSTQATTLADWEAASLELDLLEGNNTWKREFHSPDYNAQELLAQLNELEDARISGDIKRLLHLIRTSLSRNTAQMGNLKLYQYSHLGTKEIVERYIQTTLDAISSLVEASDKSTEHGTVTKVIYDDLLAARQSFGRSALLLSGGGTFGMNHIGVVKTLWEAKLLPRIISGASAGSIVAAVSCTTTDEDVPEVLRTFCHGDLAVFHDPKQEDSWLKRLAHILTTGSMFDVTHLKRVIKGLMGDMTFLEAYNRTRRILNICVSSSSIYELPKLLNYIASPNVVIWSAVAASCSVPLVFSPASLLVKDPKTQKIRPWSGNLAPQKWIDGSVENDIPMQRLSEMFNVNHFIVSQVNPHVVPFLIKEKDINLDEDERPAFAPSPSWLQNLSVFAKSEAIHRMTSLAAAGFMPNVLTKTVSVLSQTYSGDITILPEVSYVDFPKVLSNPTPDFIMDAMRKGERATWPKLSRIRNHCAIELALDNAANEVRARAVFSKAEVTARRQAFKRTQSDDGAQGRLQMFRQSSRLRKEPPDSVVREVKRTPAHPVPALVHHKAHSTQISELLASSTLSPSLAPQESYDMGPHLQAEEVLSSGPGLTSDASDSDDDHSLLSGEDTEIEELTIAPIERPVEPSNPFQSASVPSSPAAARKRSPFFLHFTANTEMDHCSAKLVAATPTYERQSSKNDSGPDGSKPRQKSQSEPETVRRLGKGFGPQGHKAGPAIVIKGSPRRKL